MQYTPDWRSSKSAARASQASATSTFSLQQPASQPPTACGLAFWALLAAADCALPQVPRASSGQCAGSQAPPVATNTTGQHPPISIPAATSTPTVGGSGTHLRPAAMGVESTPTSTALASSPARKARVLCWRAPRERRAESSHSRHLTSMRSVSISGMSTGRRRPAFNTSRS